MILISKLCLQTLFLLKINDELRKEKFVIFKEDLKILRLYFLSLKLALENNVA